MVMVTVAVIVLVCIAGFSTIAVSVVQDAPHAPTCLTGDPAQPGH